MSLSVRPLTPLVLLALAVSTVARAGEPTPLCDRPDVRPARLLFAAGTDGPARLPDLFPTLSFAPAVACAAASAALAPRLDLRDAEATAAVDAQGPPARAFVYSEAYQLRATIHKKASLAMLPLFATEAVIGQRMFNNPIDITSRMQTAHRVVGAGIGGLFVVNTVTGVMNMWEGRKDPNGLMKRTMHATLMMVADVGFLATAATRPNSSTLDGLTIYDAKKNQHMAIAYAAITTATIGYVMMLFH